MTTSQCMQLAALPWAKLDVTGKGAVTKPLTRTLAVLPLSRMLVQRTMPVSLSPMVRMTLVSQGVAAASPQAARPAQLPRCPHAPGRHLVGSRGLFMHALPAKSLSRSSGMCVCVCVSPNP